MTAGAVVIRSGNRYVSFAAHSLHANMYQATFKARDVELTQLEITTAV